MIINGLPVRRGGKGGARDHSSRPNGRPLFFDFYHFLDGGLRTHLVRGRKRIRFIRRGDFRIGIFNFGRGRRRADYVFIVREVQRFSNSVRGFRNRDQFNVSNGAFSFRCRLAL